MRIFDTPNTSPQAKRDQKILRSILGQRPATLDQIQTKTITNQKAPAVWNMAEERRTANLSKLTAIAPNRATSKASLAPTELQSLSQGPKNRATRGRQETGTNRSRLA